MEPRAEKSFGDVVANAIGMDRLAQQLAEELKDLQAKQASCLTALNQRIDEIRLAHAQGNLSGVVEKISSVSGQDDTGISFRSNHMMTGQAPKMSVGIPVQQLGEMAQEDAKEADDVFQVRLGDCKRLSGDDRWTLVSECYRIEAGDEMDVIPSLKSEFQSIISEFDLKMGDEFPRMVLSRQIQLYRWLKTFRKRFMQHVNDTGDMSTLRIVNKLVYKSARLIEDDMAYVLECRTRGIEFKLAEALRVHQQPPPPLAPAANSQPRQSAIPPPSQYPLSQPLPMRSSAFRVISKPPSAAILTATL